MRGRPLAVEWILSMLPMCGFRILSAMNEGLANLFRGNGRAFQVYKHSACTSPVEDPILCSSDFVRSSLCHGLRSIWLTLSVEGKCQYVLTMQCHAVGPDEWCPCFGGGYRREWAMLCLNITRGRTSQPYQQHLLLPLLPCCPCS
jgi:hypothetical protein